MARKSKALVIDDWSYVPFSEARVVRTLIVRRLEYEAASETGDDINLAYITLDGL